MIKVVLFGNTGLANGVFRALIENDAIELCAVYTRKLPGHFPYYEEEELWLLSEQNGIPTFTGQNVNSEESIRNLLEIKPDYIIVSSFDQIIKMEVISLPSLGIVNFHPSLLPKYRGPNPISWVLINGEKQTGLTIHRLTEGIDSGNVLYQERLEIDSTDHLGSLYNKLSILAESMSKKLILDLTTGGLAIGEVQNEEEKTYYAKSTSFRYINFDETVEQTLNRVRAFTPFPKPFIKINHKDYFIDGITVNNEKTLQNSHLSENGTVYHLSKDNCILEFAISPTA